MVRSSVFSRAQRLVAVSLAGIALLAGAAGSAQAEDRHVAVVNGTSHTMVSFFASNTGTNSWEEDILGVDTLAAGDTANIDVDDATGACHFDFKAVFDDGTSSVAHDINVCTTVSYTYTEE